MSLEKSVGDDIQNSIRESLTPYLGLDNFQVSVTAHLNTDKKQITETTFDPESRVERSVRVIKENESLEQLDAERRHERRAEPAAGCAAAPMAARTPSASNDRREETTNYELSSKTVSTVSDGYSRCRASRSPCSSTARAWRPSRTARPPEAIDTQLAEIEQLVATAADMRADRGDQIKVLGGRLRASFARSSSRSRRSA